MDRITERNSLLKYSHLNVPLFQLPLKGIDRTLRYRKGILPVPICHGTAVVLALLWRVDINLVFNVVSHERTGDGKRRRGEGGEDSEITLVLFYWAKSKVLPVNADVPS